MSNYKLFYVERLKLMMKKDKLKKDIIDVSCFCPGDIINWCQQRLIVTNDDSENTIVVIYFK